MVVLGKSNSEVELVVYQLHLDTRVFGSSVVGWNLLYGQSAIVVDQFPDGISRNLDFSSNSDELINSYKLQRGDLLALVNDNDSNGS